MKNLEKVLETIAKNQKVLMHEDIVWDIKIHEDIKDTALEDSNRSTGLVHLRVEDGKTLVTFHILRNGYQYYEDNNIVESYQNRFKDFINGIEFDWSDEIFTVIQFLHEVGHVKYERELLKYDMMREAYFINENQINTLSLAFLPNDMTDLQEEGLNIATFFNSTECQADIYAISNFIPTWELLLKNELVSTNQVGFYR